MSYDLEKTPISANEACLVLDLSSEAYFDLVASGVMQKSVSFDERISPATNLHTFHDLLNVVIWALSEKWQSYLDQDDVEFLLEALAKDFSKIGNQPQILHGFAETQRLYHEYKSTLTKDEYDLVFDRLLLIESAWRRLFERIEEVINRDEGLVASYDFPHQDRIRALKSEVARSLEGQRGLRAQKEQTEPNR